MGTNIERTIAFLKDQFDRSAFLADRPQDKKYRLEHTLRVANIGRQIAQGENLDEEALIIGCLLHDLSYAEVFHENDWRNHGRQAAKMARPFLETLDLSPEQIEEICYGIAIHVDDQADFPGERTPLALSIGDADNIDRFDVYRIHEHLSNSSFLTLSYEEQLQSVTELLSKLEKYKQLEFATKTATDLWRDKVGFQIQFFTRLKAQLEASVKLL
ncbi:MAG TPA: HD domain-containing protein [Limnochordia bacterium]|nr:HD domain-containing protein [Limnochordia bacterium]